VAVSAFPYLSNSGSELFLLHSKKRSVGCFHIWQTRGSLLFSDMSMAVKGFQATISNLPKKGYIKLFSHQNDMASV